MNENYPPAVVPVCQYVTVYPMAVQIHIMYIELSHKVDL